MNIMKWWQYSAVVAFAAVTVLVACDREVDGDADTDTDTDQLQVVATTTMLEDLVQQLGGEHIEVESLVSIGGDPHVYQPRPDDARTVAESDAVVMNGLLLEGWMENLVRHAGGERPVIVGGEAIDEEALIRVEGAVDPHIWFDVGMWRDVARKVADGLVDLAGDDEVVAAAIRQRHQAYDAVLADLDDWVRTQIETVPPQQRVLITSHDAFNYFGEAYGIDVEAVQGLSTEQEASQRDVANIIELVQERKAPAVFTETSVHPGLIEQVARETGIERAGPLYSDSVGPVDSGAHTYVGMVEANVEMIIEALDGDYATFDTEVLGTGDSQGDEA